MKLITTRHIKIIIDLVSTASIITALILYCISDDFGYIKMFILSIIWPLLKIIIGYTWEVNVENITIKNNIEIK